MNVIRFRWFQKAVPAPAIGGFAFMLEVPAAPAHARPLTMRPAPDQTVSAPDAVTMTFSESKTITVVLPKLSAGVYTVNWVAVAVDSRRGQGNYKLKVK